MFSARSIVLLAVSCSVAFGQDGAPPTESGYSGSLGERAKLTGGWHGVRDAWDDVGVVVGLDLTSIYQNIVDGRDGDTSGFATNIDYRAALDLARMGAVSGASVSARAQSRFGETVNDRVGVLLPVNMYSAYPLTDVAEDDVAFALTELNWTQHISDSVDLLAGKITTLGSTNEFMGGEGRSQFMNFQLSFSAVLGQITPYSTLALGGTWEASDVWTVSSLLMNYSDASTSSGLGDVGDGTTWVTNLDYVGSLNTLPGGGSFGFYYAFNTDFSKIDGAHVAPGAGITVDTEPNTWALDWSGWQYLTAEDGSGAVDTGNGRQDLQGLGLFAQVGVADHDANPVAWTIAGGLSGRGSLPGRDDDTWGLGAFFNELQDLGAGLIEVDDATKGIEFYYDIALAPSVQLTLDVQWVDGANDLVSDTTILGLRLNASL